VVLNGQEAQNSPISSYMGIITKKNAWAMEEDVQSSATTLKNNTPNNIIFDPNI
jgi:hypothetical protein